MPMNLLIPSVLQITTLNNCLSANFRHPYYFRGEFHPFWEMVYAREDHFQVAENEKVYTMKKGDIIFHKPMEFHRLWSVENKDVHAFIVGFCGKGSFLEQLEGGAFVLSVQQQQQIEDLISFVQKEFPRKESRNMVNHLRTAFENWEQQQIAVQRFLNYFQLFLLSLSQETSPLTVKELADTQDAEIYRKTVQLLTENVNSWISTPEIAQQLHYSESRIKRTFAKFSDIGIHKYLLKLKTAAAIRMLQQGHSCNEISRQLGFANQNYFSTVFKRETGFSPSEYTPFHQ